MTCAAEAGMMMTPKMLDAAKMAYGRRREGVIRTGV
jgi:hypothetical protein